ncbi:nucleoside triphosphate hydrolase [Rhodobacteraceae bacterium ASV31]|nr:nucleoside triphosphate hydrolase [Anianabacter salinae]
MVEGLAARILALPPAALRLRIAVSGPPGSGKSTLAEALVACLNREAEQAVLVPMDGFHLDNRVLDARGLRARKGAPETFDAHGFLTLIQRLGSEADVIAPVFDRVRDIAIAGAQVIAPAHRIAVVEGNYLLLNDAPWSGLRPLWDLSVALDVPMPVLEDRLIRRWQAHGHSADAARARAMGNDIPNARRIVAHSAPADVTL